MADERSTVRNQGLAMNKITGGIADKGVPFVLGGQSVTAIDRDAAGRRELVGM